MAGDRRGGDGGTSEERVARERRKASQRDLDDADESSYTARPTDEEPETGGSTRDHEAEETERTGSD
jgi:hypothetical protein